MNTLERHVAAIQAGSITKTNVIGIRKIINAMEKGWRSQRGILWDTDEVFELEQLLQDREPHVVGELHDTGVKLLRSPRYAKRWNEKQAGIIARLHHFSLVRFDRIKPRGYGWISVPVYRAVDATGQNFLFRNIPWQSGGNGPEICEEEGDTT